MDLAKLWSISPRFLIKQRLIKAAMSTADRVRQELLKEKHKLLSHMWYKEGTHFKLKKEAITGITH
jgi:hypothetical protein